MTGGEKQQAFYNNTVGLLIEKRGGNHSPDSSCFKGSCWWCHKNQFDWGMLVPLVKIFWEEGPDVSEVWKRSAASRGFDTEELHDVLVGAFVGGDRCRPGLVDKYWTWDHGTNGATPAPPDYFGTHKEISRLL